MQYRAIRSRLSDLESPSAAALDRSDRQAIPALRGGLRRGLGSLRFRFAGQGPDSFLTDASSVDPVRNLAVLRSPRSWRPWFLTDGFPSQRCLKGWDGPGLVPQGAFPAVATLGDHLQPCRVRQPRRRQHLTAPSPRAGRIGSHVDSRPRGRRRWCGGRCPRGRTASRRAGRVSRPT